MNVTAKSTILRKKLQNFGFSRENKAIVAIFRYFSENIWWAKLILYLGAHWGSVVITFFKNV